MPTNITLNVEWPCAFLFSPDWDQGMMSPLTITIQHVDLLVSTTIQEQEETELK